MFRRWVVSVTAALVISAWGFSGAPSAGAAAGVGPDSAATLPADWAKIEPGARVWYAFQYGGDGSQINVRVPTEPQNAVAVSVWTPEDVARWDATGEEVPVGSGTANDLFGGDLFWSGGFNQAGTYYLVVDSRNDATAYYLPTVSGDAVAISKATVETPAAVATAVPTAASRPVAVSGSTEAAAPAAKSGLGPMEARSLPAEWTKIEPGTRVWYAFAYAGDGTQINVRLGADAQNMVTFSVWTPGDVAHWAATGEELPVGHGTTNDVFGGDLFWSGSFNEAGTYYLVVDNAGDTGTYCHTAVTYGSASQ